MRRAAAGALTVVLLALGGAEARDRGRHDGLLRVVAPVHKGTAVAHPHVNVVVLFGASDDGTPADPETFRAKLGGTEMTRLFEPFVDDGGTAGLRARLDAPPLRVDAGRNKLRLQVRALSGDAGRRRRGVRDKDKVKFRAATGPDRPPVAQATADTAFVQPGVAVRFDGRQSRDPDLDPLDFAWDFGDGATSTEPAPTHVYAAGASAVTVTLTVSDGALTDTATLVLPVKPVVDPDRTEGLLDLAADGPLEIGVVPLGQSGSRTFTVTNLDAVPTSQLKVALAAPAGPFTVDPAALDLGPGESATVTVGFTPAAEGHAHARLGITASARGTASVELLAHGHGGSGAGSGPTGAASTLHYAAFDAARGGVATFGLRPDGGVFPIDNSVGRCAVPGGGNGDGDACLTNADCSAHGGTCAPCPGPACAGPVPLEPADLCGDPEGNLYVLSEDVTFTDPNPDAVTPQAATLMRIALAADGSVAEKRILTRVTEETSHMACDALAAATGRVYLPEFFNVEDDRCDRIERQALVAVRKSAGNRTTLLSRLDSVAGIDGCNDVEDFASAIAVSADGATLFAHFDDAGIWRARPSPRAYLTGLPDSQVLALHPDGSVLYAAASDSGTVGFLHVYVVTEDRVATGPLPLSALMPCATVAVPNNGGRTVVRHLTAGPSAGDPSAASVHVGFATVGATLDEVASPELAVRGTALVAVPSGGGACTAVGPIDVRERDLLSH